ncbi:hypothetical protein B0H14DRAFT_3137596 [Mycena olivaceomarginata]|nr:hypothetical protein B0H14DRAFT_3137596 [Mycena olivaceomarginata]
MMPWPPCAVVETLTLFPDVLGTVPFAWFSRIHFCASLRAFSPATRPQSPLSSSHVGGAHSRIADRDIAICSSTALGSIQTHRSVYCSRAFYPEAAPCASQLDAHHRTLPTHIPGRPRPNPVAHGHSLKGEYSDGEDRRACKCVAGQPQRQRRTTSTSWPIRASRMGATQRARGLVQFGRRRRTSGEGASTGARRTDPPPPSGRACACLETPTHNSVSPPPPPGPHPRPRGNVNTATAVNLAHLHVATLPSSELHTVFNTSINLTWRSSASEKIPSGKLPKKAKGRWSADPPSPRCLPEVGIQGYRGIANIKFYLTLLAHPIRPPDEEQAFLFFCSLAD